MDGVNHLMDNSMVQYVYNKVSEDAANILTPDHSRF